MVHDRELLDRLSAYTPIRFDDVAFRATRLGLDPLTPSLAGGKLSPGDAAGGIGTLTIDGPLDMYGDLDADDEFYNVDPFLDSPYPNVICSGLSSELSCSLSELADGEGLVLDLTGPSSEGTPTSVPEPGSLWMMGLGLGLLGLRGGGFRKRKP